jgi:hypothetical protein
LGDDLARFSLQVGAEHPLAVSILLKEFPSERLHTTRAFFFGYGHREKSASKLPPNRLVHKAIVLDKVAAPTLVPASWAKRGPNCFVGKLFTYPQKLLTAGRRGNWKKPQTIASRLIIEKMPQTIETGRKQHQNPDNKAVVTQFRSSARFPVYIIENFFEPQQIQKLNQTQKTSKGTQPLCTAVLKPRSGDFSRGGRVTTKAFTGAILRDRLGVSFNHLGYHLFLETSFGKLDHNRKSRWFSIYYLSIGARSRY